MYKYSFYFIAIISIFAISLYTKYVNYSEKKIAGFSPNCEKIAQSALEDFHDAYKGQDIIIIGDSRMAQWPSDIIERHFPNLTFLNFSVSGDMSKQTLCRMQLVSKELDNKIVILQTGINDLIAASMLSNSNKPDRNQLELAIVENISLISEALRPTNKLLVLSIIPPINTDLIRTVVWGKKISESSQILSSRISHLPALNSVDISHIFYDMSDRAWKIEFSTDALHWNHLAYESIAQLIYSTHLQHLTKNPE